MCAGLEYKFQISSSYRKGRHRP